MRVVSQLQGFGYHVTLQGAAAQCNAFAIEALDSHDSSSLSEYDDTGVTTRDYKRPRRTSVCELPAVGFAERAPTDIGLPGRGQCATRGAHHRAYSALSTWRSRRPGTASTS
jgi:hypothetical protein